MLFVSTLLLSFYQEWWQLDVLLRYLLVVSAIFPDRHGHVVLLRRAGRAATIGDEFLQQLRQSRDDFGVRFVFVGAFTPFSRALSMSLRHS
jgi:hypothetical protein